MFQDPYKSPEKLKQEQEEADKKIKMDGLKKELQDIKNSTKDNPKLEKAFLKLEIWQAKLYGDYREAATPGRRYGNSPQSLDDPELNMELRAAQTANSLEIELLEEENKLEHQGMGLGIAVIKELFATEYPEVPLPGPNGKKERAEAQARVVKGGLGLSILSIK